jgi:hypothetical protein
MFTGSLFIWFSTKYILIHISAINSLYFTQCRHLLFALSFVPLLLWPVCASVLLNWILVSIAFQSSVNVLVPATGSHSIFIITSWTISSPFLPFTFSGFSNKDKPRLEASSILVKSSRVMINHLWGYTGYVGRCNRLWNQFPKQLWTTKPTTRRYSIGRLVPTTLQLPSPSLRSISQQYVATTSHLLSNAARCTFYVYPYKHTLPVRRFITS